MKMEQLRQRLTQNHSNEEWVAAVADYFSNHDLVFGHGTDNASDEAFWLLRHLQHWRDELWQAEPDAALIDELLTLARARVSERKPMAYLLGEAWFSGLRFKVDQRVLIPRSPIAELIERQFEPWCRLAAGDRLLDVGTGSGCIAIAAAVHCPEQVVDATDVSADALAVAAENVAAHAVRRRVRLIAADLFPSGAHRYRVIISNPPYVPAGELELLAPEFAHEPASALSSGPTGLEATIALLERAREYLRDDGILIVEVGHSAQALMDRFPRLQALWLQFERGGEGVFVITAQELTHSGF